MPFAFTNKSGFQLTYLSVADFTGTAITLSNFQISDSSAMPEIDPASLGSVLALLGGVLGLVERKRLKLA